MSDDHRIAKNLFRMLHEAKEEQRKLKSLMVQPLVDRAVTETTGSILGKSYHRKTRFREPLMNMKLHKDGLFSIYSKLKYTEMKVRFSKQKLEVEHFQPMSVKYS